MLASGDESARPHKTEYTSPAPPHELRFDRGGARQLATAVRLIRHAGATAPSVSRVWHGGASTHVHVNVTNPEAGGEPLSPLAILGVFVAWVRFDLCLARLARPWMWREPSSAPLYATGAEFSWAEGGLDQGSTPNPTSASNYDIPTFFAGCRRAVHAADFGALPTAEQLERLFGGPPKGCTPGDSPGALLGRHGSMNLRRVTSYGTLEIRRFHGCLDEHSLSHWAAVCVAFVDTFGRGETAIDEAEAEQAEGEQERKARWWCRLRDNLLSCDDATAAAALAELQYAQEAATVEELAAALSANLDERSIWWLLHDAGSTSTLSTDDLGDEFLSRVGLVATTPRDVIAPTLT